MIDNDANELIKAFVSGKIVCYPTDTIWGIGCSVEFEEAFEKIYTIKKRPREKSMILLVSSLEMLKKYVTNIHPRIETLLHYHKKPLTIIYEASEYLPHYCTAEDNTIAIRLTQNLMIREIIEHIGSPIVSTSANISGEEVATTRNDISEKIISQVDYVYPLDIQNSTVAPSVLAKFNEKGELEIIRE